MTSPVGKRRRPRALGTVALAVLGCYGSIAQAQNYESYYGENPARDRGEDVKAVRYCPDKGNIVVGTRRIPGGNEVLATRTDDNGVAMWQRAYRIAGSDSSIGNAVVELSNGGAGFAITGAFTRTDTYIYVLRIRCDGAPVWTMVLENQAPGHRGIGYDIIEAPNPVSTTAPPDLVVVGDETVPQPVTATHGRIARLNAAGAVLWDRAYNQPGASLGLRFRAVTTNTSSVLGAHDLVVAGSAARGTNWSFDRRALFFRVRSNGVPVCNAILGLPDSTNEDFFGITRMAAAGYNGQSVLVGSSTPATAANAQQVYLVRFRATVCAPLVQSFWRDPQDGATAFDAAETNGSTAGIPPGIAAAGTIRGAATAGDGFLLQANAVNLGPLVQPWRYSTQSSRSENLASLDLKNNRFVMAGSTLTDWDGVSDAQDFYLVQTDPNMRTQCSVPWQFTWNPTDQPYERFDPLVKDIVKWDQSYALPIDARDEGYCCALSPF